MMRRWQVRFVVVLLSLVSLVILVLRVECAILRLVDRPRRMVLTPMESILAHLLLLRIATLGRHFLPRLILFLPFLVEMAFL